MEELDALIKKYQEGTATPEECALVERHFLQTMEHRSVPENEAAKREVFDRLDKRYGFRRHGSVYRLPWVKYATAAAVLLALSVSLYFFVFNADRPREIAATEILPGTNRATLTLADGRTIDLSEAQTGIIVGENVMYNDGSEVMEHRQDNLSGTQKGSLKTNYFVLSTPKGGTYQVTLPDGSKVWLNAGSTLKYPSRFSDGERIVEMTGEAYFSVIRDEERPFRVTSNGQQVEVLGTEFNVTAYPDDRETKTTLVEGSVRVALTTGRSPVTSRSPITLKPGEQSIVRGANIEKQQVDTDEFTAWKDGYFKLDGTLAAIMVQISRWYDVEVVFGRNVDTGRELMGEIPRDKKLGDILWMINEIDSGLKFKVEEIPVSERGTAVGQRERRLTVMR